MDSGSQLSRMLYRSYLVSGSQLSRLLSSDAGTLGWSDPVSHDCGSFVECGPTIMPHSPAKSIFRLHVISSAHTHTLSLFYTKHFLQQPTFTPTSFYTNQILHRKDLTQTNFLTNHLLRKPLCTPTNPCFGPVGQRPEGPAECRRLLNNYSHVFHVTLWPCGKHPLPCPFVFQYDPLNRWGRQPNKTNYRRQPLHPPSTYCVTLYWH